MATKTYEQILAENPHDSETMERLRLHALIYPSYETRIVYVEACRESGETPDPAVVPWYCPDAKDWHLTIY